MKMQTTARTAVEWNQVIRERLICGFWDGDKRSKLSISHLINKAEHNYQNKIVAVYTDEQGIPWEHCGVIK